MSIWGSLIGGMIGFSLGGPFGMLLGSLIGGKISRAKGSINNSFAQPQQIFALSLIVLSAKLSKADGQVSKEELIAVKDKLKIPENEIDQVGKIFNKAKNESTGYKPYAEQIAQIYRGSLNVLEEVINILFYIAEADGNISPYIVLESNPDDSLTEIRKRYIKLSKEHHPDLLLSKGVPPEVIEESKKKMRSINSAWDQVQKLKN